MKSKSFLFLVIETRYLKFKVETNIQVEQRVLEENQREWERKKKKKGNLYENQKRSYESWELDWCEWECVRMHRRRTHCPIYFIQQHFR